MATKKASNRQTDQQDVFTIESGAYSNHAQVTLSANELTIDFFYISPNIDAPNIRTLPTGTVNHIKRIIAPLSMAKGLADAIVNVVLKYEADHEGISLPNARATQDDDAINLWELIDKWVNKETEDE